MKEKKYETIIFEVEKGLKKPESGYKSCNICPTKNICSEIFQRMRDIPGLKGETNYNEIDSVRKELHIKKCNMNESMEVLYYKFDTDKKRIYSEGKKSLIFGLVDAYKNHYPITVSPDMIWILFLQGYSRFMEKYSELVRSEYVDFQGQKKLTVKKQGKYISDWNEAEWMDVIKEFVQQIKENVSETIVSNLQSNFSTTNSITLTASQVSIMSGLKHYFKYEVDDIGCGVSYIQLEGSEEDWMKMKSKLEFLSKSKLELQWWTEQLIPLIDKIIMTKRYYNKNNEINEEIREFWKNMVRVKVGDFYYDPDVVDGWIIKFIPNLTGKTPELYDAINLNDVPDQILECPITLINDNEDKTKTIYKSSIASGFFGMAQDEKSYTIRPVIGYAIIVKEKETIPITVDDK